MEEHNQRQATDAQHVPTAHHIWRLKDQMASVLQDRTELSSGRLVLIDNQYTATAAMRHCSAGRGPNEACVAPGSRNLSMTDLVLHLRYGGACGKLLQDIPAAQGARLYPRRTCRTSVTLHDSPCRLQGQRRPSHAQEQMRVRAGGAYSQVGVERL